ncbi:MAG: dihydrodipicolinate synthetase [Pedosphaera sp.]|nr:dihydrodipicolinate synthetase [Pedosphaera sp.]
MSSYSRFLTGLVAAPHTAMHPDGRVNLAVIEKQAARLIADGVNGAFICGSTGEGHSLTTTERKQVAERWREVINGAPLKLIVHAGHNSIEEAKILSAHAQKIGADAVSVMSPCYFKPASVEDLLEFCAPVAKECASLPFYFYDIPALTGVNLSMLELLRKTDGRIPNLAGIKFTSTNFMSLQECLEFEDGRFNILFGCDEMLLSALALGVPGAVGSTYNYCAPLYHKIIAAHKAGDTATAQALQMKSVKLVQILVQFGVLPAGKAIMSLVGAECGPVRPPVRRLTEDQKTRLFRQIEALDILEKTPALA